MRTVAGTLPPLAGLPCAVTQLTTSVFAAGNGTVVAPVCPGYVGTGSPTIGGVAPGTFTPARLTPSLLRKCTATFAVDALPLKTKSDAFVLPPEKYASFHDAIAKLQAYERRVVLLTKG